MPEYDLIRTAHKNVRQNTKTGKYFVRVFHKGLSRNFGWHDTLDAAVKARDAGLQELIEEAKQSEEPKRGKPTVDTNLFNQFMGISSL